MPELLIKAIDASHPNPMKDAACYKRGYVVAIMPDGHVWGREEGLPTFLRVIVYDMTIDELQQLLLAKPSPTEVDAEGNPIDLARRRYFIDVDSFVFVNGIANIGRGALMLSLMVI